MLVPVTLILYKTTSHLSVVAKIPRPLQTGFTVSYTCIVMIVLATFSISWYRDYCDDHVTILQWLTYLWSYESGACHHSPFFRWFLTSIFSYYDYMIIICIVMWSPPIHTQRSTSQRTGCTPLSCMALGSTATTPTGSSAHQIGGRYVSRSSWRSFCNHARSSYQCYPSTHHSR